ncbi:MAG: hypothetical protein GJ679_01795 [Rhodobacteraceae bacterium]|nr:hypothetical protein [Paracoccaceae bacterium]
MGRGLRLLMRTCFLHIGTEKTGTTSVQYWLQTTRQELSQSGIFVPTTLGSPNHRLLPVHFARRIDEWSTLNGIETLTEKDAHFAGFEETVSSELQDALQTHHSVVISSEHLHSRIETADEVAAIKRFLETVFDRIVVICYFRNQADMALSLFSTALRFGHTTTLEDFIAGAREDAHYYNLHALARLWTDAFCVENTIFRIYARDVLKNGDVVADFAECICAPEHLANAHIPQPKSNASLSPKTARVFRALNIVLPCLPVTENKRWRLTRPFNRLLKRLYLTMFSSDREKITYPELGRVREAFSASNRKLFDEFFDGKQHF